MPALRGADLVRATCGHLAARLAGRPQAGLLAWQLALAAHLQAPAGGLWLTGAGRCALHAFVAASRRAPDQEAAQGGPDEALLPGYTCVVVPNVFLHLGLPVRYVDLPDAQATGGQPGAALNPAPDAWRAAIGPRTRWLVVPHNFGQPSAGLPALRQWLRQHHPQVLLVEDAAHALDVRLPEGPRAGTVGDAAFFSFEYAKCLSTGLGGALRVAEPSRWPGLAGHLAQAPGPSPGVQLKRGLTLAFHLSQATWPTPLAAALAALLRAPSRALGLVAGTPAAELSGQARPDYRQGLGDLPARLALAQWRRWPALQARRVDQARRYDELLAGSPWLHPLAAPGTGPLLRYPVAVRGGVARDAAVAALQALGVEPGVWFDDVVHPAGSLRHGYAAGDCPQGEALAACILNLPLGEHAQLGHRQARALRHLALAGPGAA
ncbi:DegT/DnrJ/EryC1/StrS family aminotransferase [Ideonella livida]|uniref:DegT/DnrJ/EryC1/StrS aminotransferase family protein n=1 Tax=Ideonella livida TaxID=2707176 RepID=A0A7C9TLZ7_9BURK|nr:DegT/DnrJ/EryC1/StrS family aminotransferase [Ideonella livida]NDY92603.1 hypothetical protein [Ideonella livida]